MEVNESSKIRTMIGNDIRFNVQLLSDTASRTINIENVEAYFVNSTARTQYENDQNRFKFIRRYPIEPLVNDYISTAYCLNTSGVYCYVYDGFGVKPFEKRKHIEDPAKIKALVYYTEDRDKVQIYFPGDYQKEVGTYDLIIHATIYDPYSDSYTHGREITVSYEDIVTLTEASEQLPDGISDIIITTGDNSSIFGW